MTQLSFPCPCGKSVKSKPLAYVACCGRYIDDYANSPAPDAESLMRSRYTAFVLRRADYLLSTWDPATRPAALDFDDDAKWLGLSIREVNGEGSPSPSAATVEFVARSRVSGRGMRLHERSRFVQREGRWFYVDGEIFS